ncbi:hypothetical protein ASPZODRAFT_2107315 [Penicilliopsis zonata CBS 506.65]|uniref:Glutamate carboxypeptidase Tre2 n=1 Tax=Penicilliopsis zonata CBS 506.65 TaxID=1073090 RepID=A0A1L9SWU6_9EURO|nr:hypothetical protein ASPZODRAFT_2107315 [Penicilliopsis zonata CBS 506.65]OJJ51523.1 hypothetical protein ASPZODRAFT_2107315 [Penicilliopsis zonata CBS 506.65]
MGDDKHHYESLPIPTYEEATSSRSRRSVEEAGDDAERQGLLGRSEVSGSGGIHGGTRDREEGGGGGGGGDGYQPPTVESARSSLDYLGSSAPNSARGSMEQLRREIDEMDIEDMGQGGARRGRSQLGHRFSKRLNDFTRTLSAIHLPLRQYLPTVRFTIDLGRARTHVQKNACMLVLRLFAVILVVILVYLFFFSDLFSFGNRLNMAQAYSPASVENYVQGHINGTRIAENLKKLTNFPHMAGTEGSFVLGEWIEQEFKIAGLDEVVSEEFQVYLNYPTADGRRVAIVDPPDLAWEATLEEDDAQAPVFHGHSKSGNVTGPLVYANYGSRQDFKMLADLGISLDGAIALVRYYGTETDRALKVKAAELAGAAGCIIYSDPAQDGFVQGPAYPDGRFMPADGVQRGAVSLMSWVVGDVLTPGFASTPEQKKQRLKPEESPGLVQIPSLPIAWRDAQRLLNALRGHGLLVPQDWVGGVPEVDQWWTGDAQSPQVNLMNLQDEVEKQPIYNVLGRIIGLEQPEKKIIIGNHRDSWCTGSADPGSGTAVFLEIVHIFGELLTYGWRPLRTIEFASWDGEEYNLIGSTEHVEDRVDALRADAYAYLNVDVGVSGPDFRVAASPLYESVVLQLLNRISDPARNATLKEIWERKGLRIEGLGAGSDYVAFQDIAGTSSIDFGFTGAPYPYHSCYENWDWMVRFGDPGFQYHTMLGQFWALLLLELAENPILPFNMEAYANYVSSYVAELETYARNQHVPILDPLDAAGSDGGVRFNALYNAAAEFRENAVLFHGWDQMWHDTVWGAGGYESSVMTVQRLSHNSRMANFETHLLDLDEGGGIPNRTQFKHILFGPQAWSGYDEAFFPAIRDSIDARDWTATQAWIDRTAHILSKASRKLLY